MTQTKRALFFLGRKVAHLIPATLRPTKHELTTAARVLGISNALARRAWSLFTFGT